MASQLFTPCPLRGITLKTRLVRSATEFFSALPGGEPGAGEAQALARLAVQPLGMIVLGHTCVSPEGRSNIYQNALWDDFFIAPQALLAAAAKSGGAAAVLQLGHGGAKAEGKNGGLPVLTPANATLPQLRELPRLFADAAARAKSAGFDGIQLHCAHGYMLSQFLYPETNPRTDDYGGSPERRCRIIVEILRAVKLRCGEAWPVFVKINSTNAAREDSYFREDVLTALNALAEAGAEAAELSGFVSAPRGVPEEPYFLRELEWLVPRAGLPLLLVGGIRSLADAERALSCGAVAASMCRPLLREPELLSEPGRRSACTGCNRCFSAYADGSSTRCIFQKR